MPIHHSLVYFDGLLQMMNPSRSRVGPSLAGTPASHVHSAGLEWAQHRPEIGNLVLLDVLSRR